jgi:hypothetical protein
MYPQRLGFIYRYKLKVNHICCWEVPPKISKRQQGMNIQQCNFFLNEDGMFFSVTAK